MPQNKFLYRPDPEIPVENQYSLTFIDVFISPFICLVHLMHFFVRYGSNQNNSFVSKSGRKVKGRGQVVSFTIFYIFLSTFSLYLLGILS